MSAVNKIKRIIFGLILALSLIFCLSLVAAVTYPACCCLQTEVYIVEDSGDYTRCATAGGAIKEGAASNYDECVNTCGFTGCTKCVAGSCSDYQSCSSNPNGGACPSGQVCCSGTCSMPTGQGCDSPSLNIKPTTITRGNDRGYKQITLSWNDLYPCAATNYDILRCAGAGCVPSQSIGSTIQNSFVDASQIAFATTYRYIIRGNYQTQGQKNSDIVSFYSGDAECDSRTSSAGFCIGNEQVTCSIHNKATRSNCSSNQICAGGSCIALSDCNQESGNPFGMYSTKENCEGTPDDYKYCFLDKSKTNVDKCYSCGGNSMKCYDYKSKAACERDNCNVGTLQNPSSCEWRWTYQEIGSGVCIDKEADNCGFCKLKGTTGMATINFNAFNDFFDIYTRPRLNALSTQKYPCFESGNTCSSCGDVGCTVYKTQTDCSKMGSNQILLDNSNNLIGSSQDSCMINSCRWFNNQCKKDADGINLPDCDAALNPNECEKDYFRPETFLMNVTDNESLISGFTFTITDKTKAGETPSVRSGLDYKIYYCVISNISTCIPRTVGHGFKETSSRSLSIGQFNGILKLCDGSCNANSITLAIGLNKLKYYSKDPSNNLDLVKENNFIATPTFRPGAIAYLQEYSNNINGIYYTNNLNPIIKINFSTPSKITFYRLQDSSGRNITLPYPSSTLQYTHSIIPGRLSEGTYTFFFNGENEFGKKMTANQQMTFIVDTTAPRIDIKPNGGVVNQSAISVNVSFNEPVLMESLTIDNIDVKNNFSTLDNKNFFRSITFSEGDHNIAASAEDYAGNTINGSANFEINALRQLEIIRLKPKYGVSPKPTFNIELKTDNKATCRYEIDENKDYARSNLFSQTGGVSHIQERSIPNTDDHILYVKCNDPYHNSITSKEFDLAVDTTIPNITAWAEPDPIAELPATTMLRVVTDDLTICKYKLSFEEGVFDGYENKTFERSHQNEILDIPPGNSTYKYFIWCMNRAELNNSLDENSFRVDTNSDLSIFSLLKDPPWYTTTSVTLRILTNLDSNDCRYTQNHLLGVTTWQQFSKESRSHYRETITVPGGGSYVYYVKCNDPRKVDFKPDTPFELRFNVDTTPPAMLYVNDSSDENNSEITWKNYELKVKWLGEDNETRISSYLYRLIKFGSTQSVVFNWTEYPVKPNQDEVKLAKEDFPITLNLTDKQKYQFEVKAVNAYGLESTAKQSNGITIDVSSKPASCSDDKKDGTETDIDCGGICSRCSLNQTCINNSDCTSRLYCNNATKRCSNSPYIYQNNISCSDNLKNGNESDVDCGGSCQKCANGKSCLNKDNYCVSGYCDRSTGKCGQQSKCSNGVIDPGETGIDCGGSCSGCTEPGDFCSANDDCGAGLKCITGKCLADTDGDGITDDNDNCPNDANLDQSDTDQDGKGDSCDDDIDGDGLKNEFETKYNLDPYSEDSDGNGVLDGDEDYDNDGLTNRDEQDNGSGYCLDPRKEDTDGDGYGDKTEVDKNTDPCDANSKPKSNWWIWILLFILLILVLLGIYFGYPRYKGYMERQKNKSLIKDAATKKGFGEEAEKIGIGQGAPGIKIDEKLNELLEKKRRDKEEQRKGLFSSFGFEQKSPEIVPRREERTEQKKSTEPKSEESWLPLSNLRKEQKENIFDKLKGITKEQKRTTKDILNKLDKIKVKEKLVPVIIKKEVTKKQITPVVSTKESKVYHKKGCITIKGKKNLVNYKDEKEAKDSNLKSCNVCFPNRK